MTVCIVYCTCPDTATAERLARELVEHHLAACVSCVPGIRSVYRWQGKVEESTEILLMIKTASDRIDALKAHIVLTHPYELPEVLVVPVASGLDRYLDWIVTETR